MTSASLSRDIQDKLALVTPKKIIKKKVLKRAFLFFTNLSICDKI